MKNGSVQQFTDPTVGDGSRPLVRIRRILQGCCITSRDIIKEEFKTPTRLHLYLYFYLYPAMAPTSGRLDNGEEGSAQVWLQSFAMIIFSEIGDKTFLIAAILAMRHPRLLVFAGAFGSLVVMSILSAEMGHLLPTLIPRSWTQMAASILFLSFGGKMLLEARQMKGGNEKIQEEMREAQEEIEDDDAVHDRLPSATLHHEHDIPLEEMERGGDETHIEHGSSMRPSLKGSWISDGARNFCGLFFGQVFVQAFALTFLGEWGDRSQIATIALGAAHVSLILCCIPTCAQKEFFY